MKLKNLFFSGTALCSLLATANPVVAQGTAFTYQGRLADGANPANGSYDFRFILFDAGTNGVQLGNALARVATPVSNGLFAATLDFGDQFSGAGRWLEVGVRSNGGGAFTIVAPRQPLLPSPQAIFATSASNLLGTLPAHSLTGALLPTQLPATVVTNGARGLNLTGAFSGTMGGFSNLLLSVNGTSLANGQTPNVIRFLDNPGTEQIWIHARKNMDFETVNDATVWAGNDFMQTIDHDQIIHVKHDETVSVDHNLTETVGLNQSVSVGGSLSETVGDKKITTVGGTYTMTGNVVSENAISGYSISANDFSLQASRNASLTIGANATTTVGNSMQIAVGNVFSITPSSGGIGLGTASPQANVHIYSANNPTTLRVQSTGTPGFGRVEFVSNPQGDINEWRPAFIQSLDSGGFTGGLGFYVNGTGSGNRFATNEVMRIQNGRVGIGTTAPGTLLQVGAATCNGTTWANGSDRNAKENFQAVDTADVLAKVVALPVSRWNYRTDQGSEHLGPMAQDFYAAFGVGADDKHITTVDADGVALAAIQGLNQKLEAKNAALEKEVVELRALVQTLAEKVNGGGE